MRCVLRTMAILSPFLLISSCSSTGSDGTTPPTIAGYRVTVKSAPPLVALIGAPVTVAFVVTEIESDSTTKPAAGKQFTVTVASGGGTIGSANTKTVTTAADGSASLTWTLGPTAGTQMLRGAYGDEVANVSVLTLPLPVSTVALTLNTNPLPLTFAGSVTAVLKDSIGNAYTDRPIYWTSSNPAVATVNAAPTYVSATIVPVSVGTTTITATSEGKTGSILLTVIPRPPVASVEVQIGLDPLVAGQIVQVYPKDVAGNFLGGQFAISYQSSNPAVAMVDSRGHIERISNGTSLMSATVDGHTGSVLLSVTM